LLQRQIITTKDSLPDDLKPLRWDNPLPEGFRREWDEWKRSLNQLYLIKVPRPLRDMSLPCHSSQEFFVFADSSQDVIGVVAYIKSSKGGRISTSFLRGDSKLCNALRVSQLLTEILSDLYDDFQDIYLYSDSFVVLGYLRNRGVELILNVSKTSYWRYVPTDKNPTDVATRACRPEDLLKPIWLNGPSFLTSAVLPSFEAQPLTLDNLPEFEVLELTTLKNITNCTQITSSLSDFVKRHG
ncbi:hypothetical protein TCAL_08972, partial [Tigriopus californicus]